MKRREFIASGVAAGVGALTMASSTQVTAQPESKGKFKLKYAPHFGMFENLAGKDPIDQLKFIADAGFRAFEDNGMKDKPVDLQEKIAAAMANLNLEMGVFVATADFQNVNFASAKADIREGLLKAMHEAVQVAKRVNAKYTTVVPGCYDKGLEWDYQTANVIDNLKRCAEILEPAGIVMVLEPLNPWKDHPGLFLTKVPQAYMICKAVNSPSCKILFDIYHQQITEGNLIPNMNKALSEIGYFQVGDNPGRNEPGTGEINYLNVFKHINAIDKTKIVGMEHGNSKPGKEGEQAVLDAYRKMDSFEI
ncbi:MAG TPA: TIM barrel protein [bacterium]|nr:TIM barrel protein [bacterium]HPN44952.1 TIM barrel protein [bacterium]